MGNPWELGGFFSLLFECEKNTFYCIIASIMRYLGFNEYSLSSIIIKTLEIFDQY